MAEPPKQLKKELAVISQKVHEAELRRALLSLDKEFALWRAGKMDSFELCERIHKFHVGPNREIHNKHTVLRSQRDLLIADAIRRGLIKKDELSAELYSYLGRALAFYADVDKRNDAPEEEVE